MKKERNNNAHYLIKDSGIGKASVKDVDLSKRIVTGAYNCLNYIDSGMDALMSGSCKRTIKSNGPESNATAKIKHALFHDLTRLPGKILILEEREMDIPEIGKATVLYFETQMDKSTEGNDTLIKYQEDVYDNHSIGYRTIEEEFVEKDGQHGNSKKWDNYLEMLVNPEKAEEKGYFYALKEIQLYEGSTVGFGMNELTPYLGVKGKEDVTLIKCQERFDKLSKLLKVGSLSDDALQSAEIQIMQLKQIMDDIFSSYEIKSTRAKKEEKQTCVHCGFEGDPEDNGDCPECGDQMDKEKPKSFFSDFATIARGY